MAKSMQFFPNSINTRNFQKKGPEKYHQLNDSSTTTVIIQLQQTSVSKLVPELFY